MSQVVLLISSRNYCHLPFRSHLGAIGLVGPDEPRYVGIARDMSQTHDWITPRLYGQPWFEKPVLYYWAAAVGFLLWFARRSGRRVCPPRCPHSRQWRWAIRMARLEAL